MFKLRFAAPILTQRQTLSTVANVTRTLIRTISISSPKPSFGIRESPLTADRVDLSPTQVLSKPEVTEESKNKDNNKNEKTGDVGANKSKPAIKENPLPAITIVDVNGGYGRMDFEERMEHMDRVDRINNAIVPGNNGSKLILPLIRDMPTVVDIDAYGDDMMYEDKPKMQTQSEPAAVGKEEIAGSSQASGNLASIAIDEPHTPTTLQKKAEKIILKAVAQAEIKEDVCVAPVDIDAFPKEEEEEKQHGTVDIDAFGDGERRQLPPIPKVRNNVFKFKGITIIMPQRMLRDSTYRYRLDPQDMDKPDDMQICTFEK